MIISALVLTKSGHMDTCYSHITTELKTPGGKSSIAFKGFLANNGLILGRAEVFDYVKISGQKYTRARNPAQSDNFDM